jgi:hypothetical protein
MALDADLSSPFTCTYLTWHLIPISPQFSHTTTDGPCLPTMTNNLIQDPHVSIAAGLPWPICTALSNCFLLDCLANCKHQHNIDLELLTLTKVGTIIYPLQMLGGLKYETMLLNSLILLLVWRGVCWWSFNKSTADVDYHRTLRRRKEDSTSVLLMLEFYEEQNVWIILPRDSTSWVHPSFTLAPCNDNTSSATVEVILENCWVRIGERSYVCQWCICAPGKHRKNWWAFCLVVCPLWSTWWGMSQVRFLVPQHDSHQAITHHTSCLFFHSLILSFHPFPSAQLRLFTHFSKER